jgi:hypothetical protein
MIISTRSWKQLAAAEGCDPIILLIVLRTIVIFYFVSSWSTLCLHLH